MNHYIVKKSSGVAIIFKRYDKLDEAVTHCFVYANANSSKLVEWFILSTSRFVPDGHVLDDSN